MLQQPSAHPTTLTDDSEKAMDIKQLGYQGTLAAPRAPRSTS
jgi:hypothetical protein